MKRITLCILIMLSFFFLSSCSKETLSELSKQGDWNVVHDSAYKDIEEKGITKDNLYYAALSSYYIQSFEEAVDASRLFLVMFDLKNTSILKILLYRGGVEEANDAGKSLYDLGALNSSDKVQYFKILNELGRIDEANSILKEIRASLSTYDYCFALINGNASSDNILNGLYSLYEEEGISNNYISIAEKGFSIFISRCYFNLPEKLIRETFDGNAQYALICGDFFFNSNEMDKAREYWSYAKTMYPNAYRSRMEIIE